MVFRRGRRSGKVVIDSRKHEIRYSNLLATGGSVKVIRIAKARNVQDIAADDEVQTGCVIKAIFFENNYNTEGNVTAIFDWAIIKAKFGQGISTLFDPAIPNQDARSQVFLWGMEMPAGINNSSSVKRIGTLLIPKGKQRMSEGDEWALVYRSTVSAGQEDACGHFIYKEYR